MKQIRSMLKQKLQLNKDKKDRRVYSPGERDSRLFKNSGKIYAEGLKEIWVILSKMQQCGRDSGKIIGGNSTKSKVTV